MRAGEYRGGYTMAETVIYAALVALLLIVMVSSALGLARSHDRSRSYVDINSSALGAFGRFSRDIRKAWGIDTVASTLGASSGKLVLWFKKDDSSNDIDTLYLSDGKVKVDFNGVYQGDLTPANMVVSNLTFRRFVVASTTAIRIEMTLAPKNQPLVPALNFYSTYVLRGSYVE